MSYAESEKRGKLLEKFKKYGFIVPVLATLGTFSMWIDTRYMHKEVSDIRFIELQRLLVETQVKMCSRDMDVGIDLSPQDQIKCEMYLEQLKGLMLERNRILDIGENN
jgi:hypothetical protein